VSPLEFDEGKHFYSRPDLYEYVSIAAAQGVAAGLKGLSPWKRASLRKRPIKIFDINGKLLFLDYKVVRNDRVVGYVRTAASRVLGTPIIAQMVGEHRWDFRAAVEKLLPEVEKKYPDSRIQRPKLVCYSYPKLGVMFNLVDARARRQRLVFDIAGLRQIPEGKPDVDREGEVAWSFYDSLPEEERKRRFERHERIQAARLDLPDDVREVLATEVRVARISASLQAVFPLFYTKQLQFCPHYAYNEARSHHCFILHGQQEWDYCAVATCQMILCYYRYYYTQDQIAPSLNYSYGGCPADQSAGYESLSNNHIDATFDNAPTWQKARDQIDELRPLKSGVPHHARAVAGYSHSVFAIIPKQLYIYDPSPWDADYKLGGSIYWEDWDAITHTNFIYTRLQY
jgi:hypothetical protein